MKKRLERISKIIDLLKKDQAMTAGEIAAKLKVHRRTIYRDFAVLRDLGTEIEFDPRSGCYSYHLNNLDLPEQPAPHSLQTIKDSINKSDPNSEHSSDNQHPPELTSKNKLALESQMAQSISIVIQQHGWLLLRRRTAANRQYQQAIPWELTLNHEGWTLCFDVISDDLLERWIGLNRQTQRDYFRRHFASDSVIAPLASLSITQPAPSEF